MSKHWIYFGKETRGCYFPYCNQMASSNFILKGANRNAKVVRSFKSKNYLEVPLHFCGHAYKSNVVISIWTLRYFFHGEATPLSAFILDFDEFKRTKGSKFSYAVLQLQCYIHALACWPAVLSSGEGLSNTPMALWTQMHAFCAMLEHQSR